jgi:hypothetical protein
MGAFLLFLMLQPNLLINYLTGVRQKQVFLISFIFASNKSACRATAVALVKVNVLTADQPATPG